MKVHHADEHVNDASDAKTFRVCFLEFLLARVAEKAFDRVESVAYKVVKQEVLWGSLSGLLSLINLLRIKLTCQTACMLVDVRSERLFEPAVQGLVVSLGLEKLNYT